MSIFRVKQNIYFIAFIAAISGLLFGYDAGIISGSMLFIKKAFSINSAQVGMIVSAVPLGALFSALAIGKITDLIGRKKVLIATATLFIMGSLLCGFALNVDALIAGRLLLGFAVGMSSSLAPLYIAEMAIEKNRGFLVTLYLIAINFGIFVSYVVAFIFSYSGSWRTMMILGLFPALFLGFAALLLPESPRWLILKNKFEKARQILEKIHGQIKAKTEFFAIQKVIVEEATIPARLDKNYLRILFLGAIVSIFTQAVGINAIIYYAPTLLQKTGFGQASVSIFASIGIGFTVTLAAIFAAFFIDKFGRRRLLLSGLGGIILSLVLIVLAFHFIENPHVLGWTVLAGSIFFVACQGISVGPACFLIPSEIFPVKIRGTGMGISIAFNWLTNFLVALLFPIVLDQYGAAISFSVFLVISIIGWIVFYFYVPETRNISLEKIETDLRAGIKTRYLGGLSESL